MSEASNTIEADLLVVGGGINGVGVARDAAGRGLSVVLCERDDLAAHTSSSSTKLIHGGLRYLEHYEFRLVRHSLMEREVLLAMAPHIIWPLRFILPHYAKLRPRWLIRLGLFLYDHIGGRKVLPASHAVNLHHHAAGEALRPEFHFGFEYSDCWVQDARLVVLNACDAARHGARILTRTECVRLVRGKRHWLVTLRDRRRGTTITVQARAVVNAAGPWVETVAGRAEGGGSRHHVRLVKGSHIVVRKRFDHPYPYIFQHHDGRVLFAIPFEHEFTLLGTTDVEVEDDPNAAKVEADEVRYICEAVSQYLREPVTPDDVVWNYTGVRPLLDDESSQASKVTRDYELELDDDGPALLNVIGGKITTYRLLAEEVMEHLRKPLALERGPWTAASHLPGGDLGSESFAQFVESCRARYPWLASERLLDYCRNYGTEIHRLLSDCHGEHDLGRDFGGGLYEAEVRYLCEHEWAQTVEDILWRRTKKGLSVTAAGAEALAQWLEQSDAAAVVSGEGA